MARSQRRARAPAVLSSGPSATPLPNGRRDCSKAPSPGPGSGATSPTSTTCSRGTISDAQADAGLRFARDFRQSGMPRGQLVARYEHVPRLRKYQPPPDAPMPSKLASASRPPKPRLDHCLGSRFTLPSVTRRPASGALVRPIATVMRSASAFRPRHPGPTLCRSELPGGQPFSHGMVGKRRASATAGSS